MMVLLVHSKSNASHSASRSRGSANFARRVLMNQPCAPDGVSSGRTSFLTRPSLIGGKIVARRPGARGEFLAEQIIPGGKAFEADVAVAVIFEAHDVEIVLAAGDRQLGAPPILDALDIRCSGRARSGRPCRRRSRAARRASILRTASSHNRRAKKSAGRRRTAAHRARGSARSLRRRSHRRRLRRRQSRAATG